MRYAYNTVVRWNKNRVKPQTLNEKLKLYVDIKEGKDPNEKDKKLQRSCVWGERKFLRTVVWLGLRLKGLHDKVPANVIDESIDEALIAKENVIQRNSKETKKSSLSFKSKKDLRQTMTIRAQNFSKKDWNHFYVTHLHNSSALSSKRYKHNGLEDGKHDLRPFHFETKRKCNKWPLQKIDCDCKLTYIRKTNEWIFHWVYETQKHIRETQTEVHVVSIDPGVRTPFTWYSSTKGAGKIGEYDIGRIFRLCKHMDDLISKKDRLASSISKRKNKKALRVDKAIFRIQRKVKRLQNEIHRKTIKFLTDEFDIIVIPPFKASGMVNRKTRKITRKTVRKILCWSHYKFRQRLISKAEEKGIHVIIQNEAYTSKTCSWCGNIQNIGGSEMYKCKNCDIKIDRDINGARGIFLRALLDGAMILS